MQALTEQEIRASFVNSTQGETKRMTLPRDLAALPWGDLDFLGWRDPAAPRRAYLVAALPAPVGVALRLAAPSGGRPRRTMCSLCLTVHPGDGVALMTARRAGRAGQQGNSVGTYLCADLGCSLYLRGVRSAGPGTRLTESLSTDEQAARLTARLADFTRSVTGTERVGG